jgi:hypothetical protein
MGDQILDQEMEVFNSSDKPARVILEAWGDEYMLDAGQKCRIAFKTVPGHRMIELEYREGGIAIHFPAHSIADFME